MPKKWPKYGPETAKRGGRVGGGGQKSPSQGPKQPPQIIWGKFLLMVYLANNIWASNGQWSTGEFYAYPPDPPPQLREVQKGLFPYT